MIVKGQQVRLSDVCRLYGVRLPVNQQGLLGILAVLLKDNPEFAAAVPFTNVRCVHCIQWNGRGCRLRRTTLTRTKCPDFYPARNVLVLSFQRGEIAS